MTQAEYREELDKYKKIISEAENRLQEEINKNYNYEKVLEDYYRTNEELRWQRELNDKNEIIIQELQRTIERYEKILERVTINC